MTETNPKQVQFEVFGSSGFIIALTALLLNDYYLKAEFSNLLTGKLSDFAGLFVFSLFWFAFFPKRRRWIIVLTAVTFTFWKSPLSQPAIDIWNKYSFFKIARVIDYSDLIALSVLPLSEKYFSSIRNMRLERRYALPILFVTVFALMGTSVMPPRYTLKFDMQANDLATPKIEGEDLNRSINETIRSIAETNGLMARPDFDTKSSYNRYQNNKIYMETHFDDAKKTTFVSIEAFDPEKNRNKADQIQKDIFKALETQFKNVTVQKETNRYHMKDPMTTIHIKTPLIKFPLPSWCKSNGKDNSEIVLSFELFEKYIRNYPADDSSKSACYSTDSCIKSFCRSYKLGRVIGAGQFERAITVKSYWSAGWSGASLSFKFIEHAEDESINIHKMVEELRGILQESLRKETIIEVISGEN